MAQVNSCPGQSQVNGNVVVVPSPPFTAAQQTRATAVAKVVVYGQSEPGKQTATNPQRS
jgi:hypothetical protein